MSSRSTLFVEVSVTDSMASLLFTSVSVVKVPVEIELVEIAG